MPRQDKGTLSEKVIRRTVPVIFPRQEGRSEIIFGKKVVGIENNSYLCTVTIK